MKWIGWHHNRDVEAVMLPLWAGRASQDWATDRVLILPIGINFLYGITTSTFYRIRRGFGGRSRWERAAYDKGYRDGVAIMLERVSARESAEK